MIAPATITEPDRLVVVGFGATLNVTVPPVLKNDGDVMVMKEEFERAAKEQPAGVSTLTDWVLAPAPTSKLVPANPKSQVA
jgi:hypothetical protein